MAIGPPHNKFFRTPSKVFEHYKNGLISQQIFKLRKNMTPIQLSQGTEI